MRTATSSVLAAAGLLLATALTGCGEQGGVPASAARWRECDAAAFRDVAHTLGRVDAGEGTVVVKQGGQAGPCAGGLLTLSRGSVAGLDLDRRHLDPSTAQLVRLPDGDDGTTWLLRVDSPRTGNAQGFQPHVFALPGLAEVTTETGDPLLPFVSTATAIDPVSARCTEGARIQVFTATASKPPGVVMAWDVERATYLLDGDQAELQDRTQLRDHAADPLLRRRMPELFDPASVLADCARPL